MAELVVSAPVESKGKVDPFLVMGRKYTVPGNVIHVAMSDGSPFVIHQMLIDGNYWTDSVLAHGQTHFQAFNIYFRQYMAGGARQNWNLLLSWGDGLYYQPDQVVNPQHLLPAEELMIELVPKPNMPTEMPGVGLSYSPTFMGVTEAPIYSSRAWTIAQFVQKVHGVTKDDKPILKHELWFPLEYDATKVYAVNLFYGSTEGRHRLKFYGYRSRYLNTFPDGLPAGYYAYDEQMRTIIVSADDLPSKGVITVEYVTGGGAKAIVPIYASEPGPMYDVDPGAIFAIHADSQATLPPDVTDEYTFPHDLEYQCFNDEALQGGYQYWQSEYVDLTAYWHWGDENDWSERLNDYFGKGVNFQKVGNAPDGFDWNVSDYRSFFVQPDGSFTKGFWKSRCLGYITVLGPPGVVIPAGTKFVAPSFRVAASASGLEQERIPNGGINPASLIFQLTPASNNAFPDVDFARKCAAFKPRLMVYLRERVPYTGSTNWKEVGTGYGTESEHTGTPYWI